jgi:hypothetical protein
MLALNRANNKNRVPSGANIIATFSRDSMTFGQPRFGQPASWTTPDLDNPQAGQLQFWTTHNLDNLEFGQLAIWTTDCDWIMLLSHHPDAKNPKIQT